MAQFNKQYLRPECFVQDQAFCESIVQEEWVTLLQLHFKPEIAKS